MVSDRSLTSVRSSLSKSFTGSAGVRSTGSPNRRMGLTATYGSVHVLELGRGPVYGPDRVSDELKRVDADANHVGGLAGAAGGLGGLEEAGQRDAALACHPDQRAFLPLAGLDR